MPLRLIARVSALFTAGCAVGYHAARALQHAAEGDREGFARSAARALTTAVAVAVHSLDPEYQQAAVAFVAHLPLPEAPEPPRCVVMPETEA